VAMNWDARWTAGPLDRWTVSVVITLPVSVSDSRIHVQVDVTT
jgi:hypothetical protein